MGGGKEGEMGVKGGREDGELVGRGNRREEGWEWRGNLSKMHTYRARVKYIG